MENLNLNMIRIQIEHIGLYGADKNRNRNLINLINRLGMSIGDVKQKCSDIPDASSIIDNAMSKKEVEDGNR